MYPATTPPRLFTIALGAVLLAATFSPAHAQSQRSALDAAFSADALAEVTWDTDRDVPTFLSGTLRAADGKRGAEAARAFLTERADVFGLADAAEAFVVTRTDADDLGQTHVRVRQTVGGVPVWGAESVVHLDARGAVYAFGGDVYPEAAGVATRPAVSASAAIAAAEASLEPGTVFRAQNVARPAGDLAAEASDWSPEAELVVYPHEGDVVLAYHVRLFVDAPAPANWEVFVDAESGAVLHRFNSIHTTHGADAAHADAAETAHAAEAVGSPVMLQDGIGSGTSTFGGTLQIPTYLYNGQYYLYNTTRGPSYIRTMTANNGTSLPGSYVTDGDNSFTASSQRAAVDAHYGAITTYDYFQNTHNRNSYNGAGANITSTVNYSSSYNNAFWNGQQMVYGDGDGSQFIALVSLDIAAHELTHAVTGATAGLIYQNESGALNESVSDIFAVMVDRDDWLIGEDAYTPGTAGDALRYMDNPPLGNQPDHYSDRYTGSQDNGGVHINSGIPNKATYLMVAGGTHEGVSVSGIGRSKTEKIWYRALTTYFTQSSNFASGRAGTLQAAADLYGNGSSEYNTVANAWAAVGVGSTSGGGGGGGGGTPQWYYEDVVIESPHNYPNNYNNSKTYSKPGAQRVAMYFSSFNTERNYDFVYIKDENGTTQATYHGSLSAFWAVVDGASITANLVSDYSVTRYGYRVTRVAYYSPNPLLVGGEEGTPLATAPEAAATVAIETGAKSTAATEFGLAQSTPNPFAATATIGYTLDETTAVRLTVYDVLGRTVAVLADDVREAGAHEVRFDGADFPAGTYFYRLEAGDRVETKQMTLVR